MASFQESPVFTLHSMGLKEDEVECKEEENIGSGSFAVVFRQDIRIKDDRGKKQCAIKRISKDNHAFPRERYEREIEIISDLGSLKVSAISPAHLPHSWTAYQQQE